MLFTAILLAATTANASNFPRVDADIATYDAHVAQLNLAFATIPSNPNDTNWVVEKIQHMVDVDQYMRNDFMTTPSSEHYSTDETSEFWTQALPRWTGVDAANTTDMKSLLLIYPWFTISKFGKTVDSNAWLLVQHADNDQDFQKQVLAILTTLYPQGETNPQNYAYLFDRVASSFGDTTK